MERDRPKERKSRLRACIGAGILFLTAAVNPTLPAFADDSLTISCYTGRIYVDDIDDVMNVTEAAQLCNSMYSDCGGRCIGCFHDFDYDENICVDAQGNKFLR